MIRLPASPTFRLVLGILLIVVSPLIGLLPGPGGVFLFAGGLILVLRNSRRARRRFARAKRRWPRAGEWIDRMLRRPSAARRRAALLGGGARSR